jgi:hypothetical protein
MDKSEEYTIDKKTGLSDTSNARNCWTNRTKTPNSPRWI